MFKTLLPIASGFAYLFGPDIDDSPVLLQRSPSPVDTFGSMVNIVPTNGDMPYQQFIVPLFNGIESL